MPKNEFEEQNVFLLQAIFFTSFGPEVVPHLYLTYLQYCTFLVFVER